MHNKHLFEYAVIRIMPRVEREEFINAGVILYCARPSFLGVMYKLNEERLLALCELADIDLLHEHLRAIERICKGDPLGGAIGKLDPASRFRWLTATRSTVVQCSKVHPGFCTDPAAKLAQLHAQLVL